MLLIFSLSEKCFVLLLRDLTWTHVGFGLLYISFVEQPNWIFSAQEKKCVEEIGFKESIRLTLFSLLSLCAVFFLCPILLLDGLYLWIDFSEHVLQYVVVSPLYVFFFVYRMSLKCHSFIMSIMSLLIVIAHPEVWYRCCLFVKLLCWKHYLCGLSWHHIIHTCLPLISQLQAVRIWILP